MSLTATAVRNAKPAAKTQRLFDGGGLYLEVSPKGGKWWRFKYRFAGKEKRLSLGTYPDISLKEAREKRDAERKLLRAGIDPGEQRKRARAERRTSHENSFEAVAREWFAKHEPGWSPTHSEKIIRRLDRDLFPWLGTRPISDINAPELLAALRRIESRGALETAHRALQNSGQVFRYAVATGRATRNPAGDLRGALPPWKPDHYAAITDPDELGELLRAIEGFSGTLTVKCALRLAPMVFVRPGELRQAEWSEVDLEAKEWSIPGEKTKTREPLLVPLASQAVEVLEELRPVTGRGRYVFPSIRSTAKPLSNMALNVALKRMGYPREQMTVHGFRATARTMLDERLGFRVDWVEHQLGHSVRDPLGRAYNRTKHLRERRKMMQGWADYLEKLKANSNVVALRRA